MRSKMGALLLLVNCLFGCGQSVAVAPPASANQTVNISVDDKKYDLLPDDLATMNYVGQTHLVFGFLSEKNDLNFTFTAYLTELKPGTFQVFDCKSASDCSPEQSDKNQVVIFSPYPKTPMAPLSSARIAYDAPTLGLKPLALTITTVTDEQQPGSPVKTKRVKGSFSGVLAYTEKQPDNSWKIVGKTTHVTGGFDMFCGVR